MIAVFHHVALIVSSEKSLEFYRLLGFNESFRIARKRDTVVLMEGHGIQLEFFIDPSHKKSDSDEPIGLRHFALTVDGCLVDEIRNIQNNSSVKLDCSQIMEDWNGHRFCFIRDYDGIPVELREQKTST